MPIQTVTCANCKNTFTLVQEDLEFLKKFEVPAPIHCPDCRQQRRLVFRNDQNFYKRACDLCQKEIISIYSSDKPFPVYCKDCFWSDKYDPLQYGRIFDFNKPFFEQFEEMRSKVPRIAIFNTQGENSDYIVHSSKNKNCYMSSSLVECEDVYYTDWGFYSKDSLDLYMCQNMENCYFCIDSEQCYSSVYLENCANVNFSWFCFDCRGCSNLIGCVGLRNKENMILNQPVSKEEFESALQKLKTDPNFIKQFQQKFNELKLQIPVRFAWEKNSENCSGNYIVNSKNTQHSYNIKDVEDGRYVYEAGDDKDVMDICRVAGGEMLYEVKAAVDLKFSKFCNLCYQSSNLEYCDNCQSSHDSFGCMSLKNNRYCILNKQYTEAEYKKIVQRIKAHMQNAGAAAKDEKEYGEFFPAALSPYGYNETKANEFYSLTKAEALAQGYKWKEPDPKSYQPQTYKTPENIKDIPDSILREILACSHCGKNYKIIHGELKFYRKNGLPLPKKCPYCRHIELMSHQNPRKLYSRQCQKCAAAIETTYAPNRPEKVYCEKCYLAEVY